MPEDPNQLAVLRHEIRVVLAIGHKGLHRSLTGLLEREDTIRVVGTAGDWSSAVAASIRFAADVLVVNLRADHGTRVGAITGVHKQLPRLGIVVLTMDASAALAHRMVDAGAQGVVLTERADEELSAAVRAAARGHAFVGAAPNPRLELLRSNVSRS